MSEWREVTIGEICTITRGGSPRPIQDFIAETGTPWVKIADAKQDSRYINSTKEFIVKEGEKKSRVVYPGDFILSNSATPGLPRFVKIRACIHDGWLLLRDIKGVDKVFLYYLLLTERESLLIQGNGSIFTNLKTDILRYHEVTLPPLPEQKAIAEVLSSLDDKIDLLHRQNKNLEQMAQTLFRQWFVEEAGEEGVISDLVDFNPKRVLAKGTIAIYLEMASLNTQTFNPDGWYDREFKSGTKFINEDTLLARITPCLENGKTAYVTFLEEKQVAWGSTEYIVMRPKEEIHPFFAYTLARNKDFREYAEGCLVGSSGRQRIDLTHLKNFDMPIPPKNIIEEFNNVLETIVPKLIMNATQIRTLQSLRDTLLPKLMSSEIRVAI
jgi:type I restriction enzyme S subunit